MSVAVRTRQTGANGHGVAVEVSHTLDGQQGQAVLMRNREGKPGGGKGPLLSEDKSLTLASANDQTLFVAPALTATNNPSRSPQSSEVTQQVEAVHSATMQVRRLTPRECERLMGMEDDYTRIPWRGKAAEYCPDGPRYKACGNSMAIPPLRWIGQRIQTVEDLLMKQEGE